MTLVLGAKFIAYKCFDCRGLFPRGLVSHIVQLSFKGFSILGLSKMLISRSVLNPRACDFWEGAARKADLSLYFTVSLLVVRVAFQRSRPSRLSVLIVGLARKRSCFSSLRRKVRSRYQRVKIS